ncbi:pectinesterase family protein [Streptomyces sp. DSM 44938]|uniref:Pectinesterase family protein n=1 Tax=Streptomyces litchfieldiae TaxID=3075543 RepID=A0ABU2N1C3_9ACTN|nr:pectinesterase family protein [Streptomyces sp. DSM 44938]MDT0347397.1 pectinesterase family protein [Streptomyces sp. DSM 44938]
MRRVPPPEPRRRRRHRVLVAVPLALTAPLLAAGPSGWPGGEPAHAAPLPAARPAAADITVAQDGSGDHTTVQAAIDAVPAGNDAPVTIDVAPGTYRELVHIPADKPHIRLTGTGDGPEDVTIVYDNSAGTAKPGGGTYGTSGSATFMADADDFQARNLTFANDFDEIAHADQSGHQAVALRTRGDRILLENVVAEGDQDTLLLDSAAKGVVGRILVTDSTIRGNVDFIFGRASAVITDSVIEVTRRPDGSSSGYVTAPSTAAGTPGFLITDSVITGDVSDRTYYLGRPWHAGGDAALDPQTVVRDTELSAAVRQTPWTDMSGFPWEEDRFAEYHNTGPGAGPESADRPHLTDAEAAAYERADWFGDWTP